MADAPSFSARRGNASKELLAYSPAARGGPSRGGRVSTPAEQGGGAGPEVDGVRAKIDTLDIEKGRLLAEQSVGEGSQCRDQAGVAAMCLLSEGPDTCRDAYVEGEVGRTLAATLTSVLTTLNPEP